MLLRRSRIHHTDEPNPQITAQLRQTDGKVTRARFNDYALLGDVPAEDSLSQHEQSGTVLGASARIHPLQLAIDRERLVFEQSIHMNQWCAANNIGNPST
ncbi:hypothetical protein D3C81_1005880 [compost metagenome]